MRIAQFLALLLLLIPSSMAAQEKSTPSKRGKTVEEAVRRLAERGMADGAIGIRESETAAVKEMYAFSKCVTSSPGRVGAILATLPGSEEERSIEMKVATNRNGCLSDGSMLSFGPAFLRGGIAEGMLKRDFGTVGGAARRPPVDVYRTPAEANWAALPSVTSIALRMQALAGCVMVRAPGKVRALLAVTPATDEENQVWRSLASDLNDCIDPTQGIRTKKLQLRGVLAEAAYRASANALKAVN